MKKTAIYFHQLMKRFLFIILFLPLLLFCGEDEGEKRCTVPPIYHSLSGDLLDTAQALADQWMEENLPEENWWNWQEAVLMFGLVKIYEYTEEPRFQAYYQSWIDYHLANEFPLMYSDHCPPGIALSALYQETCSKEYKEALDRIYTYLENEAPRTPEGGISHLPGDPQLWIDSLFMFGVVLTRLGYLTGENKYFDLITEQVDVFASLLQDEEAGLFRHAWIDGEPVPTEPVFWARGNGWVLTSLTELLSVLPSNHPKRGRVMDIYNRLVSAVVECQDNDTGLWWTVIDRPGETYLETSASALFTYSLAKGINQGLIGEEYLPNIEAGIEGLEGKISIDGEGNLILSGTSVGTQPGGFDDYAGVEVWDNVNFGIGAVILAFCEEELRQNLQKE
ncbi:MAG: glycoside hydrolase family 88 protein [Deltaproteobacteria bacterium]|nr:MAG: glycoside hydrolase family 88 protein [Deltaproteobacteria bacterium]